MALSGWPRCTAPPLASRCETMGLHNRSGWLPSRKAVCEPSASFMNRFIAVSTTVIDNLSGSMKSSALPIAMKISSLMRSGMPYLRMNSSTDSSSCRSMKGCPSVSIGRRPGTIFTLSASESISLFARMASAMLNGAGTPSIKLKDVNSPGRSCIANVILWSFHCSRSSMPSSAKRFIMFGYAPKNMCSPVSIQSPSSSCQALTFPPSTSRASYTCASKPASAQYFAHASPLSPPPTIATRCRRSGCAASENLSESSFASAKFCVA
mmetsp:Transcript_29745/g.64009  ORF Transcript_29745/g.64009 Transcript_29745/m.64009 type:complete len:266 (-) Transcript_29745:153-950(-)